MCVSSHNVHYLNQRSVSAKCLDLTRGLTHLHNLCACFCECQSKGEDLLRGPRALSPYFGTSADWVDCEYAYKLANTLNQGKHFPVTNRCPSHLIAGQMNEEELTKNCLCLSAFVYSWKIALFCFRTLWQQNNGSGWALKSLETKLSSWPRNACWLKHAKCTIWCTQLTTEAFTSPTST